MTYTQGILDYQIKNPKFQVQINLSKFKDWENRIEGWNKEFLRLNRMRGERLKLFKFISAIKSTNTNNPPWENLNCYLIALDYNVEPCKNLDS